jgi:hypothetical protein
VDCDADHRTRNAALSTGNPALLNQTYEGHEPVFDHVTVYRWVRRFTPLPASELTTVPASPARLLILQRDSAAEHASSERSVSARNNAATTSSLTLDIADVYVDIYVTT